MPKLSVNFWNRNSQDSHKNQYPGPVLNFGFIRNHNTVTNVDQICRWSAISLSLVAHTEDTVLPARSSDSCSGGFVWNQLPRVGIITWSNDVIAVPTYKNKQKKNHKFSLLIVDPRQLYQISVQLFLCRLHCVKQRNASKQHFGAVKVSH